MSIASLMQGMGRDAVRAARVLANAAADRKNAALAAAAAAVRARRAAILAANASDVGAARSRSLGAPLLDRLQLDEARVEAMARGIEEIAALPDPIGAVVREWRRPNGLLIQRVRVPL
ncbi:MAG TPA: gamma-glutamyl-phosphate reductase, partial [Steroidobacteraceae bacterium]|nr:gamma-glutamyl-phosphate reductase [Steroidobacteraceae bacterium]